MKRKNDAHVKEILVLILLFAGLLGFVIFAARRYPGFMGGIFYNDGGIETVVEGEGSSQAQTINENLQPAYTESPQTSGSVTEIQTFSESTSAAASESAVSETTAVVPAASGSGLRVTFLDVGQGDAALVTCDGMNMIIDGGEASCSQFIYSYLQSSGITYMHYMIASHPHSDHVGGLSAVYQLMGVERLYTPVSADTNEQFNSLLQYANQNGTQIIVPSAGEVFYLGSARVEILGPLSWDNEEMNNNSLALRIVYGNTAFLFTGDSEFPEENLIVAAGFDLKANVLKAAHHGSAYSTGDALLEAAAPSAVVISCGKDNTYGHPAAEMLNRLDVRRIPYYTTVNSGSITCYSDGTNITWNFEK